MDLSPEERHKIHREEKERIAREAREEKERIAQEFQERLLAGERLLAQQRSEAYWATVKLGKCPQCGSPYIHEFQVESGGDKGAEEAACCIGCCLFWPLALLAPFLGNKPVIEVHRQCASCGFRWRV
jgi:hypothetical protein